MGHNTGNPTNPWSKYYKRCEDVKANKSNTRKIKWKYTRDCKALRVAFEGKFEKQIL